MSADETGVTFTWKDYRHEGPDRYKTMTLPTALARALVNEALILDEPLGQLDSLKFEPHLQLRHFCSPYNQDSALLGLRCEVLEITPKSGSHVTDRWRKVDSNHRSPSRDCRRSGRFAQSS
jgi:hypothetical protein